jgi:lipoprotein NlpI
MADFEKAIEIDPKLAPAYTGRGIAYEKKGDHDRAIADYSKAIELDPKDAHSYYHRGNAYERKGEYDRAIADFDKAIELNPKLAGAYNNRGIVHFVNQDYDHAIADYNEAIRLDPKSAYPVLWRYLARARSGSSLTAAAELETDAERNLKQPDWPFPVVELFLGRRTPEATLEASTNRDDRCEAQFYVGEWRLSQGDRPAAVAALKMAADTCSKTFYEYGLAQAELHRLGQ